MKNATYIQIIKALNIFLLFLPMGIFSQMSTISVNSNQALPMLTVDAGTVFNLCTGDTIQLNGTHSGGTGPFSFSWSPTANLSSSNIVNPLAFPAGDIMEYFNVIDFNGCSSMDSVQLIVHTSPVSSFTSVNNLLVVNFTDASTGSIISWAWDFGDGGTSVLPSPQHSYAAPGNYNVCLTVNTLNCSDTHCESVNVALTANQQINLGGFMNIWPLPAREWVNIFAPITNGLQAQLRIISSDGRLLSKLDCKKVQGGVGASVSLSGFSPGIYFVEIVSGETILRGKIIVE